MEILIGQTFGGQGENLAVEIPGIGTLRATDSVLFPPYQSIRFNRIQLLKLQYQIAQELLHEKETTME